MVRVLDKAIDCDVTVGPEGRQLSMRLVGIPTPKGHCFFLTNLPGRIGPWQVGELYLVRWEVELANKLDKSIHRLDESRATRACSVKTMLHASLLASTITTIAVHKHHMKSKPEGGGARESDGRLGSARPIHQPQDRISERATSPVDP